MPDDKDVSLTWRHCSKGFVMKLWEAYLGQSAEVKVVESCISGAERCKFAVRLPSSGESASWLARSRRKE
jgi:hypothetical protein